MSRPACVDVPALPLQLLLRRHPEWRERPAAVTSGDSAGRSSKSGARDPIVWVNRRAVRQGVRPGMTPAAAAAVCPDLRIGRILPAEIEAATSELAERLYRWSPVVESATALRPSLAGFGAVGSFWLRASGLSTLFGPLPDWVESVRNDLAALGFRSSVAVGFSRFGAFAAARARFGARIFEDPAEEREAAGQAPLVRFGLSDRTLTGLEQLGIRSLRDILRLSGKGLGDRYGEEARQLHRLASGEIEVLASCVFRPDPPLERRARFDPPETESERLLFSVKRLLDEILDELRREGLAVLDLSYEMRREDGRVTAASVLPTAPSLDGLRLLSLLRLRLEADSRAARSAPESLAMESIAPESIAPESIAPESIAPESIAPESIAPESIAMESIAMESSAMESSDGSAGESAEESPGVTAFVLRARAGLAASEPQNRFAFGGSDPGAHGNTVRRDRKQGAEALASIRAEFGEGSLVRIETREAHLPRARFRCEPISPAAAAIAPPVAPPASFLAGTVRSRPPEESPGFATSAPDLPEAGDLPIETFPSAPPSRRRPTLVRRIYDRPLPLPRSTGRPSRIGRESRDRNDPETWLLRTTERGPIRSFAGPYRIDGGWWRRLSGRPFARDYYFVRLQRGEVCWIFYDRERRSWFLEGRVE